VGKIMRCTKCLSIAKCVSFQTFSYWYCGTCKEEVTGPKYGNVANLGEEICCSDCGYSIDVLKLDISSDKSGPARLPAMPFIGTPCPRCFKEDTFYREVDIQGSSFDLYGYRVPETGYEIHIRGKGWI